MAAQPLDITIPPEALAGAERAYGDCNCPACKKAVRRVAEGLLKAWPGMRMMVDIDTGDDAAIKLPFRRRRATDE